MPKIVINEYDKTKAIANEYANFAVVIPGPVDAKSDLTVFDDNGIYECSSQTDFVEKIGLLANVAATEKQNFHEKISFLSFVLIINENWRKVKCFARLLHHDDANRFICVLRFFYCVCRSARFPVPKGKNRIGIADYFEISA